MAAAPAARSRAGAAPVRRVQSGRPEILTGKAPVLNLTRLQSGIGALTITAACSDAVGDLRLGCAYRLRDGVSSAVQLESGLTVAPPGSTRPILIAERERFETVTVDLRQIREVGRLLFYAFSASGGEVAWGGTLTVTTLGGGRLEIPMDSPKGPGVMPLATVYNVDGELVVRSEPREVCPTVREVCLAFGFDRIAWLDPRTPVA